MNFNIIMAACAILLTAILGIATSAIAVECYNQNAAFKEEKKSNWIYTITNLICNILMVLVAFLCMYLGATAQSS